MGVALAVAFATTLVTGIFSHYVHTEPVPAWVPARPVWIYRVTGDPRSRSPGAAGQWQTDQPTLLDRDYTAGRLGLGRSA